MCQELQDALEKEERLDLYSERGKEKEGQEQENEA